MMKGIKRMRRLFICNTHSQLINALHMTLSIFKDEECDALITDQSNGLEGVYERLRNRENHVFDHVYFIQTKKMCSPQDVKAFLHSLTKTVFSNKQFDVLDLKYDEVIYYNYDFALLSIFDKAKQKNPDVKFSRFEEGVLSYTHEFTYSKLKLIKVCRKLIFKKNIKEDGQTFYCYFPELYTGKRKTIKIPLINDDREELKSILFDCYSYNVESVTDNYKFIFFTSVYDFEGGDPIGEYQTVEKIADIVGKNNILIKKHPRDSRDVYEKNGFNVEQKSSIPWEVMQFKYDLSKLVMLSVNSSAILSSSMLFNNKSEAYFTFGMCDLRGNELARESIRNIQWLLESPIFKKNFPNIQALSDLNQLEKYE